MAKLENIKELRSVASEFPVLSEFLENVSLISAQEAANSENKESITMMTIHAAKGLEFGVVFIPGMEEGMFPHSRSIWDSDQLEEERRLAYVALTRAKEILYITYSQSRLLYGQRVSNPPSRFIADIPTELIDTSDNYVDQPKHFYEFD
jgi:DNA helicase-2/ATP-dependent DNA helicase PcrA